MKHPLLLFLLLSLAWPAIASGNPVNSVTDVSVVTHDNNELVLHRYTADGEYLLVFIGSGYGFNDRTVKLTQGLVQHGIEVWKIDFAEALFQTSSSNFIRNLNAEYVADIIEAAHHKTGKKIALFARAYGAIPVLRGATLWQQRTERRAKLIGAILLSPDLFTAIPSLGQDPEYLPITTKTTIPLIILQADQRASARHFPQLLSRLNERNPGVYFSVMKNVSGILYEGDTAPETLARLDSLPKQMTGMFKLLEATPYEQINLDYRQPEQKSVARLDSRLKPFTGNPVPPPINLTDINGKVFSINDYTGRVTLVNFWATWCPPCVEEIPSLNRLRQKMSGKPFRLISVNYAEPPEVVRQFMQQVNVEFPVLMDLQATTSAQWNVIAFPSTFVIGPDGKIHYGVNAAIAWDDPEVIRTLDRLLQQSVIN